MTDIVFVFLNDTATTEIYTLSLHDALPISSASWPLSKTKSRDARRSVDSRCAMANTVRPAVSRSSASWICRSVSVSTLLVRSEEHTSELQSRQYLVCRLLLEKKKHYDDQHI